MITSLFFKIYRAIRSSQSVLLRESNEFLTIIRYIRFEKFIIFAYAVHHNNVYILFIKFVLLCIFSELFIIF